MVQSLNLQVGTFSINQDHCNIIKRACEKMKTTRKYNDKSITFFSADDNDVLITWRPKFAKDILLFFDNQRKEPVVIAMDGDQEQFFAPLSAKMDNNFNDCFVLHCHVTCDVLATSYQPVILAYDITRNDCMEENKGVTARYHHILELKNEIEEIVIGLAPIRVQWMGFMESYDKLSTLDLPHEKDCVVFVDNNGHYAKAALALNENDGVDVLHEDTTQR